MPSTPTALRAGLKTLGILALAYLVLLGAGLSRLPALVARSCGAILSIDWWRVAPYSAAAPLGLSAFLAMAFALEHAWGHALLWTAFTLACIFTCLGLHQFERIREFYVEELTTPRSEYDVDHRGLHVIRGAGRGR